MRKPIALVVDDEADIRSVIAFVLELAGYEVYDECDGEAGLAAAGIVHPDVVLVDWRMPRMDGLAVCEALRSDDRYRSTVVILLSANAKDDEIEQGIAAGAQEYILKPFSPRHLVQRVDALLAASH